MLTSYMLQRNGVIVNDSKHTSAQMVIGPASDRLEREGTAEIKNDPRFFSENVLSKRLEAFEALAIIMEIFAAIAIKQCFALTGQFAWTGPLWYVSYIQIIGFFSMMAVMVLATVATAVLSLQLFFSIRLLTAGPTGFDKAAYFYSHKGMWRWRERAIFGVKYTLVLFFFSTGCMLFTKFYTEGAPEVEEEPKTLKMAEYRQHTILSAAVCSFLIAAACFLFSIVREHQAAFDDAYGSVDACHNELNRHLISRV